MRFIVNFANPFPAQLFCKFLHISIDGMLFKEVVERENTAFFHYTERFTDNQAFIGLGFYLMENKVADSSIKVPRFKWKPGGIALQKADGSGLLQPGVFFALFPGVIPFPAPIINSRERGIRPCLCTPDCQGSGAAADVQQPSFAVS